MSISTELTRLQTGRNKIRAKLTALGLAQSTDKLDALATAIEGITDNGAVSANVQEGETYTVPKGYHSGQGAVSIEPEVKSATPTKAQQTISPTEGKVLSTVTVEPIPAAYQDVTPVTAGAADVLTGKTIVAATGEPVAGSMANNGAINKEIDGISTLSAEIPAGYTSGGTVTLTGDIEAALAAI